MAEGGDDEKASARTASVFISYASQDASVAAALVEALEGHGITCWIAPRDVKAGALYADAIVRAISGAKAFVLVLSVNSIASSHVSKEIERASSKKCPIIALRIDAAPLTPALEYFLSESQWIESQGRNINAAYVKLVEAIREPAQAGQNTLVPAPPAASASTVSAARRKLGRNWILLAAGLAAGLIALAALLAPKFWPAKHSVAATPTTGTTNVVSDKSIAVLPFLDLSEKHDQEYFSDGLSEELIDLLAKVPDLRVPARTSSFFFKGKPEDIEGIAQKLRVAHVLEGSIRKAANRIRVTAQLIRADNGYHLWSETYDRELKDVFEVQDDIAGAVVSALKVKLDAARRVPKSHRTANPEAHDQFLLSRQFFERGNLDNFRRAAAACRKAIELDPDYAAAYAELSVAELYIAEDKADAAGREQALAAAAKAVELAPEEADGYAARGNFRLHVNWDWIGAQADLEKALAFDTGNRTVQVSYSELLLALGRRPEAIAAAKKAADLDPLSNEAWSDLGLYLLEDGQLPAAHEALRRALEIQPESSYPLSWLGELQLLEGKASEALPTFRRVDYDGFRLWGIAMTEHTLGHARESEKALDELIAKYAKGWAFEVADVYAWRGEKDKAFEWLERSYQQHESDFVYLKDDVILASLHSDPRYRAFLHKMNLPE